MKLNARQVDTAKLKDKSYKLSDGGGRPLLALEIPCCRQREAFGYPDTEKSWMKLTTLRSSRA